MGIKRVSGLLLGFSAASGVQEGFGMGHFGSWRSFGAMCPVKHNIHVVIFVWFSWTAVICISCSEKVTVLLFSCNSSLHLWHLKAAQSKCGEVLDSDRRKSCASKNVCAQCQENNCLEMSLRLCKRSCWSSVPGFTKKGGVVVLHSHRHTEPPELGVAG